MAMRRLLLLALATGCTAEVSDPLEQGTLDFEPTRPELADVREVAPYEGDDPVVLEAQTHLATGFDLQTKVVQRTCGPTGGVCHNSKEYPALHTPANFVQAIGAPCNVQPGTHEAVYDRCERPGDRIQLDDGPEREIAWLQYVPGERDGDGEAEEEEVDAETPGLHVYLDAPIGEDAGWRTARFVRKFVTDEQRVEPLPYFTYRSRFTAIDDGTHLYAEVRPYQADQVQELLTVGVVEGDANRNGVFGARQGDPVALLEPGRPEESYLIARLRGEMMGETVPGSRMPLANQPLSIAEMLALFCFVEGLPDDASAVNLASPIDYAGCSYSDDPESLNLLGSGVTWEQRIRHILEFNCGGCHSEPSPEAGLSLKDGDVYARLLETSTQIEDMPLITPGDPDASYLWLKITGDERIVGAPMPLDPISGDRRLSDAELADIQAWIEAGAVEDQ
ncbi:MAG: hypothetical protein PVI30_25835 [Myxococcales bacterium]